jgi:hypothetical protein
MTGRIVLINLFIGHLTTLEIYSILWRRVVVQLIRNDV